MRHIWWRTHWREDPELELIDRFGGFSEVDEMMPSLVEMLALPPGGSVLDLGCSHGSYSIRLAQWGYEVTGVVESEALAGLARQRAESRQVAPEFRVARPWSIPDRQAFDGALILDFGGYGDADNAATLRTAADALKPGGSLVFGVCNPYFWAREERTEHHAAEGLDVIRRLGFDYEQSVVQSSVRCILRDGSRRLLPRGDYRAYTIPELRSLTAGAGLAGLTISQQDLEGRGSPDGADYDGPYFLCSALRPRAGEAGDGI